MTKIEKLQLLNELPESSQNPLLSAGDFFKYCKERFEHIGITEESFLWLLSYYKKKRLLLPTYSENNIDFYSSFQVYSLYILERCRADSVKLSAYRMKGKQRSYLITNWEQLIDSNTGTLKRQIETFNRLLVLLCKIQDFYLPEVRSDNRWGESRDYHGFVAIHGTYFVKKETILLSSIRNWREQFIVEKKFNPLQVLEDLNFKSDEIKKWITEFSLILRHIDPLERWYLLLSFINYNKRQQLRGNALLAQDFYEMAQILYLYLKDIGENLSMKGISDIHDVFDTSSRDEISKLPKWKERKYGKDILENHPYQMLEFLCNEWGINPKPRAIIFTEGEEWKAIRNLFEYYQYNSNLLGIEFRSIKGDGEFTLANWQCFIEYMHEKQVLIYFIVDNEGENAKQARRLLKAKRKFDFKGLIKVIPSRDRIKIWGVKKHNSSFEEANFTDSEIARAINMQTKTFIKAKDIKNIRYDATRKKGLIRAVEVKYQIKINKPKLVVDLVDLVIKKRQSKPNSKHKRPIENFVLKSGDLILLNHQPTGKDHQKMNIGTGLLG